MRGEPKEIIFEDDSKVDEEGPVYAVDKQEYMHWYYKLNHPSYIVMSRMAKQHMLPRRITKILRRIGKQDTRPPMCNDCCGAKATRRPWRTSTAKENASHIKTATNPGDAV